MIRISSLVKYVLLLIVIVASQHVAAQSQSLPYGLNQNLYNLIPQQSLAVIDSANFDHTSRETVGYNFKTQFTPSTNGQWKNIVTGMKSWFLKIHSSNAYGIALVLTEVRLHPGESIYVYNLHGLQGPFTYQDIPPSGILPLDFLKGEELMIEFNVADDGHKPGAFIIESVCHAYRNIFVRDAHHSKSNNARYSDNCYLCLEDEAIADERRAIVKLVIQYEFSTKVCTGTLVNNTANDNIPYILTAEHCVSNQSEADRTVFLFGYEDERCVQITHYDHALSGAYHRASSFENDFALLELYEKPPLEFEPYYAGWDISDEYLNGVTCIHHAEGGPKKVSISNGTVKTSTLKDGFVRAQNGFWKVIRWDVGATELGSSGASLLNRNSQVMGTLSGGSSRCESPYNDYFQKLSSSWEPSPEPAHQLKHWLDPSGSGTKTLEGKDPFEAIQTNCNMLSNVQPGEQLQLVPYPGDGYFSGFNSDNIASYAEKFSVPDSVMITSAQLHVGSVNEMAVGGLFVRVHINENGLPGESISENFIPYSRLSASMNNYVGFYPYVKVGGDFFISYTISYSPEDFLAINQTGWRDNSINTAFIKVGLDWAPMTAISPGGSGTSLGLTANVCEVISIEPPIPSKGISLYPNPSSSVVIVKLPDKEQIPWSLKVYDIQGREQNVSYTVYANTIVITTVDLSSGLYILSVSSAGAVYQGKFIKI